MSSTTATAIPAPLVASLTRRQAYEWLIEHVNEWSVTLVYYLKNTIPLPYIELSEAFIRTHQLFTHMIFTIETLPNDPSDRIQEVHLILVIKLEELSQLTTRLIASAPLPSSS